MASFSIALSIVIALTTSLFLILKAIAKSIGKLALSILSLRKSDNYLSRIYKCDNAITA